LCVGTPTGVEVDDVQSKLPTLRTDRSREEVRRPHRALPALPGPHGRRIVHQFDSAHARCPIPIARRDLPVDPPWTVRGGEVMKQEVAPTASFELAGLLDVPPFQEE
jgi:hypothetical protein